MRKLALTTMLLGLVASPAWCEGPVSTAPSAAAAPVMPQQAAPAPLDVDGSSDAGGSAVVGANACGAPRAPAGDASAGADTAAHGQVDVAVGTNGYRYVGVYACKPVGGGSVAISVDHSEAHWGGRR